MSIFSRLADLAKSYEELQHHDLADPEHVEGVGQISDRRLRDRVAQGITSQWKDTMVPRIGSNKAYRDRRDRGQFKGQAFAYLDMNGLTGLNETLGHPAGDTGIIQAGNALADAGDKVGNNVRVHRKGGDEFVVVGPEGHLHSWLAHAEQAFAQAGKDNPIAGQHKISFSAGLGHDEASADAALKRAKAAQYQKYGRFRRDPDAKLGHGENFIASNLPGSGEEVAAGSEKPAIPAGLQRPDGPLAGPQQMTFKMSERKLDLLKLVAARLDVP